MSLIFETAAAFRKQLESNLRTHSVKTGENIQRLRRKVAFDRLLARIFTQDPSPFFLKGGYAMELRVTRARATKDMDLTCLKRGNNAKEPISELILQELQLLARVNLNDHFIYQIGQPQSDIENAPYGGSRHSVLAVIDNRPFVEFHLDVGGDFLIDQVEKIPGTNWLNFCGIAAPTILMISVEQQFAEKLHSYTLPREQINTRTKDLIDLILLLNPKNRAPEVFQYALQRVFRARNTHPLPTFLPDPPLSWQKPFDTMAAECGISQNLKSGFTKVSEFYTALHGIGKSPM
ncbi:MAG: nucleotidyl transferase AbiEii/AbiGii toxin family protein [Chlamydiota bacterium]